MKKIELTLKLIIIACGLIMYAAIAATPFVMIGYIVYDILNK